MDTKKTLRVGICGCGGRGTGLGQILSRRNDAQIAAVCDTNPVRMRENIKLFKGDLALYPSLEAMLNVAKLDAVIITVPDYLHEETAVTALKTGVNTFIDKPLATTAKGCKRIIDASKKHRKVAMVGFNLRHLAVIRRLKEIVDEGTLGNLFLIENREFYSGGRTYMARWNRNSRFSGGLWIHKGSHDFDIFNWMLGFPKPVKVTAFAGVNVLRPDHLPFKPKKGIPVGPNCSKCAYQAVCPDKWLWNDAAYGDEAIAVDGYVRDTCIFLSDKDTHDNGIAMVEYENGARASHLECFVTSQTDRLYTLVGDRGQAEVSLEKRTILVRPRWNGELVQYTVAEETGGHGGADPNLMDTFLAAVRGRASVGSTLEHGLWSTAIGQAAELSRRESRVVQIAELL